MIKNSLKLYFKSYKYFFIPIVTILICGGIGFLIFYFGAKSQLNDLNKEMSDTINNFSMNINDFIDKFIDTIKEVGWHFSKWFKDNLLEKLIKDFIEEYNNIEAQYKETLNDNVTNVVNGIGGYFAVFMASIGVGIFLGSFLTGFFIKKNTIKKSIFRTILVLLLDSLFQVTLIAGATYLFTLWEMSFLISIALIAILYSFISLVEAWFAQRDGKLKFRKVVNFKSILIVLLCDLLVVALTVGICVLLSFIPFKPIALVSFLPVIIIGINVFGVIAEYYAVNVRDKLI
jgi:hypothetical protein